MNMTHACCTSLCTNFRTFVTCSIVLLCGDVALASTDARPFGRANKRPVSNVTGGVAIDTSVFAAISLNTSICRAETGAGQGRGRDDGDDQDQQAISDQAPQAGHDDSHSSLYSGLRRPPLPGAQEPEEQASDLELLSWDGKEEEGDGSFGFHERS